MSTIMETPSSPISDDALAESIDDSGVLSSAEVVTDDGCIESELPSMQVKRRGFPLMTLRPQ